MKEAIGRAMGRVLAAVVVVEGIAVVQVGEQPVGAQLDQSIPFDIENSGRVAEEHGAVVGLRDIGAAAAAGRGLHAVANNAVGQCGPTELAEVQPAESNRTARRPQTNPEVVLH